MVARASQPTGLPGSASTVTVALPPTRTSRGQRSIPPVSSMRAGMRPAGSNQRLAGWFTTRPPLPAAAGVDAPGDALHPALEQLSRAGVEQHDRRVARIDVARLVLAQVRRDPGRLGVDKVSAGVPADANWPGDRVRFVTTPRCGATTCVPARSSWAFSSCASAAIRAGLSWPPGPSWGDAVAEAEEVLGLFVGAEFMRAEQRHAVRGLQLGHRLADGAVAGGLVHGIDGQRDVALLALKRRVPVFRRVLAEVAQDVGTGRHALLKRQRKGLQRGFGNAQRLEPLVAEGDSGPGVEIVVEALGRRDVGGEPRDQVAAARGLVHMQHGVDADIRLGARPQDQRLNVVELQRDPVAAETGADGFKDAHQ